MSASGNGEVLRPILLRSMTPGPNEKVLKYLDDMDREGNRPDNRPPRSIIDPEEFPSQVASPRSQAQSMRTPGQRSEGLPKSPLIYTNGAQANGNDHVDDDIASDIQEGTRSELGEEDVHREPGPNDPPGPKYESYDSGPSFGNFGPLPSEDRGPSSNPFQNGTWNPGWGQGKPQDAVSANGTTPGFAAAKVPLPASEFAMSPRGTNDMMSPRAGSRAGKGSERPFSPMSARSGKNTVYPPLPESRIGDEETMGVGSPMARSVMGRSKAPSISPSDSASHMKSPAMTRKNMTKSPGPSQLGSSAEVPKSNGRSQPGSVMSAGGNHQNRPFSPYRHAPTNEDLLYAAVRGRAMAIPEEDEQKASTVGPQSPVRSKSAASQVSKAPSQTNGHGNGHAVASPKSVSSVATPKPPTVRSTRSSGGSQKAPSAVGSQVRQQTQTPTRTPSLLANGSGELQLHAEGDATPRARSPDEFELNREEARIVNDALMASRTPRTSYIGTNYEPDAANAYHDHELCVLLHQESDPAVHELVKKALRKAIKQRVKRLGMKYDNESIRQIKRTHHDHDPSIYGGGRSEEPPQWATDLKRELVLMQQRVESLGPKIDNLQIRTSNSVGNESRFMYDDDVTRTPQTQTVNIQTQHTGTAANSMYQGAQHEITLEDGEDFEDGMTATPRQAMTDDTQSPLSPYPENQDDSTGQQILEEEMYRLRQRPRSQSRASHNSWEVAREQHLDDFEEGPSADQLPDIPDADGEERSLPALPEEEDHDDGDDGEGDEEGGVVAHHGGMVTTAQGPWTAVDVVEDPQNTLTPWQRVQQRLLQWAVVWPMSEIDGALNSTTRGNQVDEVALSIWSMQTYKRYVRQRLTDNPQGVVDRLFVPPNMADAISNAVFNGQHGNACAMLRELWAPFGLPGMPRLLVVLAKHRSEADHWVVHRYSLPDGTLVTYDSFPGRTLMDGRPLGWWFAIRIAWPNANYPAPDHLEQKMVRLHRPLQLPIDNSVAAAGIWRNILMGSRGERSLDLERLRDLINTEVKNLRQRKQLGRLSIAPPNQAAWGSPL